MKKSKKIPKSHLPKFGVGGGTAGDGTEGTQNIYNDKRSSKLNIGQYANYATAAVNLGTGLYNNQNLQGAAKNQANANTINSTVDAVAGSATPWYGYAKTASGIGKSMTSPTSVTDPTTGETITQSSNKTNQAFSDTFTPMHETAINDFSSGNAGRGVLDVFTGGVWNTMDNYLNGTNQKKFDKAKANEATYNQQQTDLANQQNAAAKQQQDSYINNMVTQGINDYASQNKGSYIKYPHGGMNMQPNAEIEKQENVVDPNGSFLQVDGSTHENGGVPVALPGNSMIFSDRLKLGKKTFAELNKVNNTNKEDKILESNKFGNTSKRTAELMKFAKNKNSEELFGAQEALKQAKVEAYAKKMGVTLPQVQEAPEEGMQYPMGGVKLPMYPDGGPVDSLGMRVNTLPNNNFKFSHKVGNKEVYVDPGNMQRAYEGSNKTKDVEGYNNFLRMKMASGISPEELVKQGYATNSGISQLKGSYNPRFVHMENFGQPSTTPTNTQMPYDQRIDRKEVSQNMSTDVNYYDYPDANAGYSKATRVAFDRNSGREIDPMKSYDPKGNYTPYFNLETGRDLYKNTIKSSIPGTNPTNLNLNNQGDIRKEAIQSGNSFKYGGRKLPKYYTGGEIEDDLTPEQLFLKTKFMGAEQNQRNLAFNQMTGNTTSGYNTPQSSWLNPAAIQASSDAMVEDSYPETQNNIPTNQPNAYLIRKDKNGKLIFDNPNAYKAQKPFDFAAADARQQAEIDAVDNRKVTDPNDKNFDWGSLAQTGQSLGNFALQNAGNIYDLTRKQDPLQKYARAKASFLDPSSAIRDALAQTRRAEYNIRNASGGNAGTYLANRVGLNAQNTENLARIHQNYANANAGIANQNSQFNTEIAYREAEAQAKDRAMRQNVNSQAIHSMASNFGKASKASKENSMDQKELDLFMYRYKNEPGFKEQVDKFRTA